MKKMTSKMNVEPVYLVYKSVNGNINTHIEYGDHTTGEHKRKKFNEIKRFKIEHETRDIELLKTLYPLNEEG